MGHVIRHLLIVTHRSLRTARGPFRAPVAILSCWLALMGMTAFPSVAPADICARCDVNGSNFVDQGDVLVFKACKTNSGLPTLAGCEQLDLDLDGDVDQSDFGLFQRCLGEMVEPSDGIITEFMASNHATLQDNDGNFSDWIEIHNPGNATLNLNGWYLTDNIGNLTKWQFPDVAIPRGGYLIVFASDKNRATAGQPLHTNFKLDADEGEYLALVRPDGVTVTWEYAPRFPPQSADISYGVEMAASTVSFVAPGALCRAIVPTAGPLPASWNTVSFDDSSWTWGTTAVGYERASGYETLIGLDVGASMYEINATALVRVPFLVDDPGAYLSLTLAMRYDDGFVAYINGHEVARANATDPLDWNSGADADHPDSQSLTPVTFDLTDKIPFLQSGLNVLAIRGLNHGTGSSDFLVLPELSGTRTRVVQPRTDQTFTNPSPGWANGSLQPNVGPVIAEAQHAPAVPTDHQDLTITARVTPGSNPLASVTLFYRVMFGSEVAVTMLDDGVHGDGAAGDGVYGATIPAVASTPGQMVRWYFLATDTKAITSRWPKYLSALESPQYLGTIVDDPSVSSQLPVLHWFVQDTAAAQTDTGTRASVFYLGRFYDNLKVHLRGDTSSGWPKKNFKFNFNSGDRFIFSADEAAVDEFNLNSTYSDKSYMRQVLAMETYRDAGAPYCYAFPMRVQQNGQFYSVAEFIEEMEEEALERLGLDPDGALYKMHNSLNTITGAEKKTREDEDMSDLQALISGLSLSSPARTYYLYDNIDIPACIDYIAATCIMHDNDHVGKNYYVYRKTEGSGEWLFLPWDKDLTFGRNFTLEGGVINDTIWANVDPYSHPRFGDSDHPKCDGPWNCLIDALLDTSSIRAMYLRRLRTLMDEQLQAPGTAYAQLHFENRIDQLVAQMQADVILDRNKWGNMYGLNQDLATATSIMKNEYLAVRRTHLYTTHGVANGGIIPNAQPADAAIVFGTIEHSPTSGIQDEEYIELKNNNAYAVDITGWKFQVYDDVEGKWETKHKFRPGTVIRAGSSLYLSPKVTVFRARATSPKGGEGRFIQGNYDKHIAPGEMLRILNTADQVVATATAGG